MALVIYWNQHTFTTAYPVNKVCNNRIIFGLVIAPQWRISRLEMFFKIDVFKNWFCKIFKNTFFFRTLPVAASFNDTKCSLNLSHATGHFLCPLKTSEKLWFSDVFRRYRKRPVAWNGLIISFWGNFQPPFSCPKLAIEVIEKGVTYVKS